jgi:tRNA A-37 threonylcarbamoyl transferase component Bud32
VSEPIRWLAGEPALCAALGRAWLDPAASGAQLVLLRDKPGRRGLYRVRLAEGDDLFVKRFYAEGPRHPLRDRAKRALRLDVGHREWRNLRRLQRVRVRVPAPRALGVLPGGDTLLAMNHVEGRTFAQALAADPRSRRSLLLAVGDLVASFHAAGFAHWDLHHSNLLLGGDGPLLVDLQAAWRVRAGCAQRRDLGELDHSLQKSLSLAERVRLRARAMGLERPFSPEARRRLRAVGRASRTRGRAHAASRRRRALRSGRRFAGFRFDAARGLRLREVDEAVLTRALRAHRTGEGAQLLRRDERTRVSAVAGEARPLLVKEFVRGGWASQLADVVRGSPARRAWLGGYGLQAHRIGAATPLAFLERRRLGVPVASTLVLEDLRPGLPADAIDARGAAAAEVVDALARLALQLHARGVVHGDLKASRVRLARRDGRLEAKLIDLEGLRFARRLSDASRLRALAELNASLPDSFPDAPRRRAFALYAALLPFRVPARQALRELVAESLAREHRWTGSGCALAREIGTPAGDAFRSKR